MIGVFMREPLRRSRNGHDLELLALEPVEGPVFICVAVLPHLFITSVVNALHFGTRGYLRGQFSWAD